MATIREVAKRARVSLGTVSNILGGSVIVSPELRARVERAMRELDYHPNHAARVLKSRRTDSIAVIISDLTNPFFSLVIRGAEDAALARGNILSIFNTDDHLEREQQIFRTLRSRRVDGVLAVVAPNGGDSRHIRDLLEMQLPLVCMDRVPSGVRVDRVLVDNVKGVVMCMRHLAALGHKRIGMVTGPLELQTSRERSHGYKLGLSEARLPAHDQLFRVGDFRFESGYCLTKDLCLGRPPPTAVFVANGTMGLGAVKAIQELGLRCPEDIAIAIFDDVPGADVLRPRLTVVSQPAYDIGFKAAELLLDRIGGLALGKKPILIKLEPELIVRESTIGTR